MLIFLFLMVLVLFLIILLMFKINSWIEAAEMKSIEVEIDNMKNKQEVKNLRYTVDKEKM